MGWPKNAVFELVTLNFGVFIERPGLLSISLISQKGLWSAVEGAWFRQSHYHVKLANKKQGVLAGGTCQDAGYPTTEVSGYLSAHFSCAV